MTTTNSSRQVFQFRLSLDGIKPAIWRRILVPADIRLSRLHQVIQAVMDWKDCHLHEFNVAGQVYGIPDPDGEHQFVDDRSVCLRDLNLSRGDRIGYIYDFGDEWRHVLQLEEVLHGETDDIVALCIGGERNAPPEDVGGVFGYEEFLEALSDANHEQHRDRKEWIGYPFDSEQFSVEETNKRLRK